MNIGDVCKLKYHVSDITYTVVGVKYASGYFLMTLHSRELEHLVPLYEISPDAVEMIK